MGLMDFLKIPGGRESKDAASLDDYAELDVQEAIEEYEPRTKYVKVCKLKGFADVDITARELSEGNIVILDIRPLAERSMNELKHAVDEVKDIVRSMKGDVAGLSEYHLIITPPSITIDRTGESRSDDFEETMERVRRKVAK